MALVRDPPVSAWFTPQSRDSELAQHAHRLEFRGAPTDFVWPGLCPACGAAARDRLDVRKVFFRRAQGRRDEAVATGARRPRRGGEAAGSTCP
jgi:hypothetical protein